MFARTLFGEERTSVNHRLCLRLLGLAKLHEPTHYDVLGIEPSSCTTEAVASALSSRRRQLRSNLAGPHFLAAVLAFERDVLEVAASILSDTDQRLAYDRTLAEQLQQKHGIADLVVRARHAIQCALDTHQMLPNHRREILATELSQIGLPACDVRTLLNRIPVACDDDNAVISLEDNNATAASLRTATTSQTNVHSETRSASPMTIADRIRAERTPSASADTWLAWGSVAAIAIFTTILAISAGPTSSTPHATDTASAMPAIATHPDINTALASSQRAQSHNVNASSDFTQRAIDRAPTQHTTLSKSSTAAATSIIDSNTLRARYADHTTIDGLCGDLADTVQAYSLRIARWTGANDRVALIAHHTRNTRSSHLASATPIASTTSQPASDDPLKKQLALRSFERLSAIDVLATRNDAASLNTLLDTLRANVVKNDALSKATVGRTLAALERRSDATLPTALAALLDKANSFSAFHISRVLSQHTGVAPSKDTALTPVHTPRQRDRCADAWKKLAGQGVSWTPSSRPTATAAPQPASTASHATDKQILIAQQFVIASRCLEIADTSLEPYVTLTRSDTQASPPAVGQSASAHRLLNATDTMIVRIDGLIQTHPQRLAYLTRLDRIRSAYRARLASCDTPLQQIATANDTLAQLSNVWASILADNNVDAHHRLDGIMKQNDRRIASATNVFEEMRESAWTTLRLWEVIETLQPRVTAPPMLAKSTEDTSW